jgi:hypothetical protein
MLWEYRLSLPSRVSQRFGVGTPCPESGHTQGQRCDADSLSHYSAVV